MSESLSLQIFPILEGLEPMPSFWVRLKRFLNPPLRKAIVFSLIIAAVGVIELLVQAFPCQVVERLRSWDAFFLNYLFFLIVTVWPFWWSIDSTELAPLPKLERIAKFTLSYSFCLLILWIYFGMWPQDLLQTFLFNRLFVRVTVVTLALNFWKKISKKDKTAALIPLIVSLGFAVAIPLTDVSPTKPENFSARSHDFEAVVALVESGELIPDTAGVIELPCRYNYLANRGIKFSRGTILLEVQEDSTTNLRFRQGVYGFGDVAEDIIYRSDDRDISLEKQDEWERTVKLKDHWFWKLIGG